MLVSQRAVLRCECGVTLCALCRVGPWWCEVSSKCSKYQVFLQRAHGEGAGANDALSMPRAGAASQIPMLGMVRGDRLTVYPVWSRSALCGSHTGRARAGTLFFSCFMLDRSRPFVSEGVSVSQSSQLAPFRRRGAGAGHWYVRGVGDRGGGGELGILTQPWCQCARPSMCVFS